MAKLIKRKPKRVLTKWQALPPNAILRDGDSVKWGDGTYSNVHSDHYGTPAGEFTCEIYRKKP